MLAESSRLISQKYLATGQNPLCNYLTLPDVLEAQTRLYHHACLKEFPTNTAIQDFHYSLRNSISGRDTLVSSCWRGASLLRCSPAPGPAWGCTPTKCGRHLIFWRQWKGRLDSRLAMCMLLRTWGDRNVSPCVLRCRIACGFPDDLIVNIQHCGYAFLSVLWQGTLDVSIFYKFKSALVQIWDRRSA